jgi:S-adenosyl-L-methionine hydrolase (adenosine-forming)
MGPKLLTLTTDFGTQGTYVASVKGTILTLAPGTTIIDVTHQIAPQNILEGAFVLGTIVHSFPKGTVHLAVVDPGVGTDRRILAVEAHGQWFVAPDNGLLSCVLAEKKATKIKHVVNPAIRRERVSSTFHGRDIMAPAAAFLLNGGDPNELGPELEKAVVLSNFLPRAIDSKGEISGEVVFRDAFGNLITNIPEEALVGWLENPNMWEIEIGAKKIDRVSRTYGESQIGELIALIGSEGWLEIAVVNGDAARALSVAPGTSVWVRRRGASR